MIRKKLSKEDSDYLLSLNYDTLNKSKIKELITDRFDKSTKKIIPAKYGLTDELVIPKGHPSFNNESIIVSTVGRYILNVKLMKDENLLRVVEYINEPVTKDYLEKVLYRKLSDARLKKQIEISTLEMVYDRLLWFNNFIFIATPSISEKTYKPDPVVMKRKAELLKKYENEIKAGDIEISKKIEDELKGIAKERLKDDYGFDIFNSGGIGKFDANYVPLNIMKGGVKNRATGEYDIVTSNYIDGVKKEELQILTDGAVESIYSKGVGTQIGGYNTKMNLAAFQSLVLDDAGTDCGTKLTIDVDLQPNIAKMFLYSYIVDGGKLVLLTDENLDKYIGKKIKLRSAMVCKSDKICNKCAGDLFYMLEVKNAGLMVTRESASLLNKFMKVFHDASVKLYEVKDANEFIV